MKKYIPPIIKNKKDKALYEKGLIDGREHLQSSPETKIMFTGIKGTLDRISDFHEGIKEDLGEIKEQTTLHNGRMKNMEIWRGYITGAVGVIVVIVLPLAGLVLIKVLETKELLSAIEM